MPDLEAPEPDAARTFVEPAPRLSAAQRRRMLRSLKVHAPSKHQGQQFSGQARSSVR
jgi:hypothetical protein